MPTCRTCGTTFELSPEVAARYPGWEPAACRDCHRARDGASGGGGRRRSGGAGAMAGGRAGEENLTVAEVLARYTDGPDTGVFTDGSANPNPGPGGWGAVYVVDGEIVAMDHGHDPDTTNNRMELQAIIRGIALVPAGTPATVHTDSRLAVQTLTEWAPGWKARGWKRRTGPVENLDLVQEAYALVTARPEIELTWVKAHSGLRWNEVADSLSTAYTRTEV
jgi:ribonuclease HI